MNYKGRRVLVIGGTGFVGSRLAARLHLEEQAKVTVLVRNWAKAVGVSCYPVDLVHGDVLDLPSLTRAMEGVDTVFHCASGMDAEGGYSKTNIEGTQNVLAACTTAAVRQLVYVSSIAVHGTRDDGPINEDSDRPLIGRDYSDSKILAENLVFDWCKDPMRQAVVLRPTYIWGPGSSLFTVRPLLQIKAGTLKLVDRGERPCTAVHVDNFVDAMLLAGTADRANGRAFIIHDGGEESWRDFFEHYRQFLNAPELQSLSSGSWVAQTAGRAIEEFREVGERLKGNPAPLWRKVVRRSAYEMNKRLEKKYIVAWDLNKFGRRNKIDISAARNVLGYRPRHNIATGMQITLAWAQAQMRLELGIR